MRKSRTEFKTYTAILDQYGATYTVKTDGKKHIKIYYSLNGNSKMLTVSRSASDHRAQQNNVSILKRELKLMG